VRTRDVNGNPVEIPHHKHGHVFRDVDPPFTEGPHYLGKDGKNIFYRP
jgi:hypothetical protein